MNVAARERIVGNQPRQKVDVVGDPDDMKITQRGVHARESMRPILTPDDQLRDHRVVVRRDLITGAHAGIDAHRCGIVKPVVVVVASKFDGAGLRQMQDSSGRRQESFVGILGIDARFERVTTNRKLLLQIRDHVVQRFAVGHAQLPFDQVVAGDHLGDRMLDLQPRVHLHEEKLAGRIGNELDRAGANVANGLGCCHCRFAHRAATCCGHAGCRRFFDDLLMPALHRAVALKQADARCRDCRQRPESRCGVAAARTFRSAHDHRRTRLSLRAGTKRVTR